MKARLKTMFLTVILVAVRLCTYVTSPLWLDALRGNNTNTSAANSLDIRQVNPYFVVLTQGLVPVVIYGVSFLLILFSCRNQLSQADWYYPKKHFLSTGTSQEISAVMINYALSGTRSPPYLIALLGNFLVPIQFVVRFFILKKIPTRRKVACAAAVVVAEFTCLLPNIIPGLDPSKSHQESGGQFTGPGAILFPLSFVAALIPGTMVNALMERSVKDADHGNQDAAETDVRQLNIAFYQFALQAAVLLVTLSLFWIDLIPGYGTSHSMNDFVENLGFNFDCLFGQKGYKVVVLAWVTLVMNSLYPLFNSYLLRHSEGANYMTVAMTIRSPLLFLFWTLFDENPFNWHPHTSLTTWLSIGALVVMVPAVYLYNTGQPERECSGFTCTCCQRAADNSSQQSQYGGGADQSFQDPEAADTNSLLSDVDTGYVQYRD